MTDTTKARAKERFLRRLAVDIIHQLPHDEDDARRVMDLARKIYDDNVAVPEESQPQCDGKARLMLVESA